MSAASPRLSEREKNTIHLSLNAPSERRLLKWGEECDAVFNLLDITALQTSLHYTM